MTAIIRQIAIDSRDSYRLSKFWEKVTGWREDPNDPNEPQHSENLIQSPDGTMSLLFLNVPESKQVKNRVHLDLTSDTTRDEEVERLVGIGATIAADFRTDDGRGFVVLADPEGNEFCIVRNDVERADDPS
ncbi:VOC family protein [Haloglycomyces albus]|uniref:VOC family protein n=1 Tax=Haloglycomyces albus TaxID=526067 RepID=UPI00046D17F2|nr:VOC family protein [Haloglycomyces albus]